MPKPFAAVLFGLLCCFSAHANPLVQSVSVQPLVHGASVTLAGQSFGSMNGTVVTWDDFESQTVNTPINGRAPLIGPAYTTLITNNEGATFSAERAHGGSKSAKIDWTRAGARIASFGWAGQGPFSQLYISYWRYLQTAEDPLLSTTNHKSYYLYGSNSSAGAQMPQAMPLIPMGTQAWGFYNNVSTSQGSWSATSSINNLGPQRTWSNTINQWNRWEFWQKLNTDVNCTPGAPGASNCDGELKYWIDAVLAYQRGDYKHRFVDGRYVDFRLGMMHGPTDVMATVAFDDLYIATTQARVEIGNAASWTACTHREIQVPVSWSDTEIQVTVNRGSFPENATAYLFVVDANGIASAGREIKLGTGSLKPSSPVNVKVN